MNRLSLSELRAVLGEAPPPVLVDVRLPEDFAAAHLPGAIGACVFEVSFPAVIRERVPDLGQPVVVYGAAATSQESAVAAEKLGRLGYGKVRDFAGGLDEWRAAGLPVEGTGEAPAPPPLISGRVPVDGDESKVEWLGRNLLNKHAGSVALTGGWLDFSGGVPTGGEFTLDLRHLTCHDLAGSPLHDVLIAHLQSDDFFDVERFPTARFRITAVSALEPAAPGGHNLQVTGELTLRGRTEPLAFTASGGIAPDGRPAAQAVITIDRTRWGVIYGSGRFFHRLAGHLVNDHVEMQVRLVGKIESA